MAAKGKSNKVRRAMVLRLRFALAALVAFSLVGCASSSSSLHYYLLHNTSQLTSNVEVSERTRLTLQNISLPDYLKQRGLVYQISETNIHIATDHLWAESLNEGIIKSLSNALRAKDINLKTHKPADELPESTLSLVIDDFVPTWKGDVVLRGYFTLHKYNHAPITKEFYYTIPLEADGFSMSVKAMRKGIDRLANNIGSLSVAAKEG